MTDRESKLQELERLRSAVRQLEAELGLSRESALWPPANYYTVYHVLAGFVLGILGATTSLLFNVVGSLAIGQHPLQLIRIYLTFPLGEQAKQIESGLALAIGCCLYLGTGMLLGVPFQLVLSRWFTGAAFVSRFMVVTLMSLALWIINFYGILSWLQPLLIGGNWIIRDIPWWVAASTHLIFGWTMLLVQPLGTFVPYRQTTETP